MFETVSLLDFFRQIFFAIAGAASLWGAYFIFFARKGKNNGKEIVIEWVAYRLLFPLFLSVVGLIALYLIATFIHPSYAHEGISVLPTISQIARSVAFTTPLFFIWSGIILFGVLFRFLKPKLFSKIVFPFYIFSFIGAFILISLPGIASDMTLQAFFVGHGFHSIFTIGTVLMLDYIFIIINHKPIVQQNIFPFLPLLSKVIWVGLGIDFISVLLIFPGALDLTPVFHFIQTIVAIVIINGVILSGPLSRKILSSVKKDGQEIKGKWGVIASLCGVISVVSWGTITFLDFFKTIDVTYNTLWLFYIGIIFVLFLGHRAHERFEKKQLPPDFV
ncbi:MAG: hypothetical protein ACI9AR_000563 [Flavobacteriaceae bacterium]|jgi:hypothetical protein